MIRSAPLVALSVALLLAACAERPTPARPPASVVDRLDQVIDGEPVLAMVDGSRIGELDLTINLERTLGDAYAQLADAGVEEKVLESMIASRAIALRSLADMGEEDRAALEKRVAQFREELLVKQYLVDHADPHTVTTTQIEDYYAKNTEEFAGDVERLYEIVTVTPAAYERDPAQGIRVVSRGKTSDDWRALARESVDGPATERLAHSYRTLVGDEHEGAIEQAVLGLEVGRMSRLVFSGGAPYLVRLLEETRHDPIPLEQARAAIKRKLLPASVRRSVREISEQVLDDSDVVLSASADATD